jgi:hypothetical protein
VVDNITQNILVRVVKLMPGAARELYRKASIKDLKKIISYNQVRLADYTFLASKRHKRLANELEKLNQPNLQTALQNLDELRDAYNDLSIYLEEKFREIAHKNFDSILKFFEYKSFSNKRPRVCIKAVLNNTIITLVRDRALYQEEDFIIDENTAFIRVNETGKYYCCNNIPKEILRGAYKNARIDESEVQFYYRSRQPGILGNLRYRFTRAVDEEWKRCWRSVIGPNNGTIRPPIDACYKSTLVMPLSLVNTDNWLSPEFRSHFRISGLTHSANFGFLCLDHQNKSFFDEDEDVDLCYTFANILSLYLIVQLNYTTYSPIFKRAEELINGTNTN